MRAAINVLSYCFEVKHFIAQDIVDLSCACGWCQLSLQEDVVKITLTTPRMD